mgnify:CR=1 FL=1
MQNLNQDEKQILKNSIDDIEVLEQQKQSISDEIKYKFKDLKDKGFNVDTIKKARKLLEAPEGKREAEQLELEMYIEILR